MDHADHCIGSGIYLQKEKIVKKGIAFFDFDGTITTKDTLLEFIKFSKGNLLFYAGFLLNLHFLVAYKLKIISNQTAKEKILRFFFKQTPEAEFISKCSSFTSQVLPGLLRKKALDEIRTLREKGYKVVVVSASPENWILGWTRDQEVDLIASRLEIINGNLTGNLIGKNCHGEEKVTRISEIFQLSDFDEILAYGDTSGDKPMLRLAHTGHFKPFR